MRVERRPAGARRPAFGQAAAQGHAVPGCGGGAGCGGPGRAACRSRARQVAGPRRDCDTLARPGRRETADAPAEGCYPRPRDRRRTSLDGRADWSAWLRIALIGVALLLVLSPVRGVAETHSPCAADAGAHCDAIPPRAMSSTPHAPEAGLACAGDMAGCHVADCGGAFLALCGTAATSAPAGSLPVKYTLPRRDIGGTAPAFDPPPPRFLA